MNNDKIMTNLIAVFCRYERDFDDLTLAPKNMFRRIRNIDDIRGCSFIGVIGLYDWYNGEEKIMEAHDCLHIKQPELFD
jgi:hypothetical protein